MAIKSDQRNCMICNCENSIPLDKEELSEDLNEHGLTFHTNLCRSQIDRYETALNSETPLLVGCTQEAPIFLEVAEEAGFEQDVSFINIRENAGWSEQGEKSSAKIAALIATADHKPQPARLKSIESDGLCLVYGSGQQALEIALMLNDSLSVTLLLSDEVEISPPARSDVPIYRGTIAEASGSFGDFSVTVDNYAALLPSSRDGSDFTLARDGAKSNCSLIFDISGNTPLFSGYTHRDGYKRVDPGDPLKVLRTAIELKDLVGDFEKPIYVDFNEATCAHSRSQKTGCSKCLDVCPAGAISDAGDVISIDSGICGGCGSCHAVCPTGSISYQYPQRSDIVARAQKLLSTYQKAGGNNPVLLVHNEPFGSDVISMLARYGRGLPANVLPYSVYSNTVLGHVELSSFLAAGYEQIIVLANPTLEEELSGLRQEASLTNAIVSALGHESERVTIVVESDPDRIEEVLWGSDPLSPLAQASFTPIGSKRDIGRLALSALHEASSERPDSIALPVGAPYGRLEINQEACTLCMACTSACPANAILDTPGEPTLRFVESACVQCSLCVNTCPEKALSLVPQYNFTSGAMQPIKLYEEEPFECISCGTPFATKSTIERISEQLAGKHSMFASSEKAKLIQMCENCRLEAQANSSEDPFSSSSRPRVRTTEDYIKAEKTSKNGALSASDFLIDE